MGTDIKALLDVLSDNMAKSASDTYAAIIAAALFLYFGVMCMFIVILRKKINPKEENAVIQSEVGDVELANMKQ